MASKSYRLLNHDGSYNVVRPQGKLRVTDLYHSLLTLRWRTFWMLLGAAWLGINLLFALSYLACGPGSLVGTSGISEATTFGARFQDAFFFSVHTLATIGYGNLTPRGLGANLIVTVEAFLGLMGLAMATGLLFNRFSRPSARVIFSNRAIIATHDGVSSFIFRLANARMNQVAEAQISVTLAKDEYTEEGERYRTFNDLCLERSRSPIFMMSWTIVHPIDKDSPLFGMDREALVKCQAEVIVTMTGIDDTFAQSIHARFSYVPEDMLWDRNFVDILKRREDGKVLVHLEHIHDVSDPVKSPEAHA